MIISSLEAYAHEAGFHQLNIHSELTAKTFMSQLATKQLLKFIKKMENGARH